MLQRVMSLGWWEILADMRMDSTYRVWGAGADHGCGECVVGLLAGGAKTVRSDAGAEDEYHGE